MVNKTIVSRYQAALPPSAGANRTIRAGPLYPAADVMTLLTIEGSGAVRAWTRKASADLQKLSLDADDLVELIKDALTQGRYRRSEWCIQRPNGPWAACDAYSLERREWNQYAHKELPVEYYVKFAIAKTGKVLLLASCHLPENR